MRFAHPDLLFLIVLFLHIGGAIVAFGPTFAFPIISAFGGREPAHTNFALRAVARVANLQVLPVGIWVGLTGLLLIMLSRRNILELWLLVAIVLYVIALAFSMLIASPLLARLIEATSAPPPEPPPGSVPPSGSARPSGPPPHIAALVATARRNGMIQGILVFSIALLMVFKPVLA